MNLDDGTNVHDRALSLWQNKSSESLLFYDGRRLICGQLNPRAFLRLPARGGPPSSQQFSEAITDLRCVDVFESGKAFQQLDKEVTDLDGVSRDNSLPQLRSAHASALVMTLRIITAIPSFREATTIPILNSQDDPAVVGRSSAEGISWQGVSSLDLKHAPAKSSPQDGPKTCHCHAE